jgi:small subunit ribosomal protein S17
MTTVQAQRKPKRPVLATVRKAKMQKTVVVAVERTMRDARYQKVVRRITTLKAHDEQGISKPGDRVEIVETRPVSKDKHWKVVRVVQKAALTAGEAGAVEGGE